MFPFKTFDQFAVWAHNEFDLAASLKVYRPEVNIRASYPKLDVSLYKRILTLLSETVAVDEWIDEKRYQICLVNKEEKAPIVLLEYTFKVDQRETRQKIQYLAGLMNTYIRRSVDRSHILSAAE